MNCAVETLVNKTENLNPLVQENKNNMVKNEGGSKSSSSETKSAIIELFPWLSEFRKMYMSIHMGRSMASLTELMQFYLRNVSISVIECYTRPLRAAKLKDCISESLLLFLYMYRELSKDHDRSLYLSNMSDLLALYIDMELKASRKSKEDQDQICARLTSYLYVYLDHSTEHLLDTLIKIQFMCRSYHHILDPIVKKVVQNIPLHPESNVMFVRYLLVYRLWRKINGDLSIKNQITTAAIASLGPLPSEFPPAMLENVLPKVPKCQPNSTKALLQHKFDVKKCCELFIQFCREKNGSISQEQDRTTNSIDTSNRINLQMLEDVASKNVKSVDNNVNSVIADKVKQNEPMPSQNTCKSLNLNEDASFKLLGTSENNISVKHNTSPKTINLDKSPLERKSKKSNEILFIDLTSDVVFEKCIKKRKCRKLPWLEEAKKRIDSKALTTSRKIKKAKEEKIGRAYLTNTSKSTNNHTEDTSETLQATDSANSESVSHTCKTVDISAKNADELKMNGTLTDCSVTVRKTTDLKVNNKDATIQLSCTSTAISTLKPSLSDLPEKPELDTPDIIENESEHDDRYASILSLKSGEGTDDRLTKQTVIQRLIEKGTSSEIAKHEEVESLTKICDLKTEPFNTVNNVRIRTENNSKNDHSNRSYKYLNLIKDQLTQDVTSSMTTVEYEQNVSNVSNELNSDHINRKHSTSNQPCIVTDIEWKCTASITPQDNTNKNRTLSIEISPKIECSVNDEEKEQPCPSAETLIPDDVSVMQEKLILREDYITSDTVNRNVNESVSDAQMDLEIGNYVEVQGDTKDDTDIRESIFKTYSTDRKNICSKLKVTTSPMNNGKNNEEVSCVRISDIPEEKMISVSVKNNLDEDPSNGLCDESTLKEIDTTVVQNNTREDSPGESIKVFDLSHVEAPKRSPTPLHKTLEKKNVNSNSESKCIMQDSDLQDNIDGLSLLASVSQHIPHLKAESNPKCDQIKVKDYASMRNTFYNQVTDDETDTSDSSNTVSQLLENPSTEVINRIVGIYPEDALDKVALHVEVTSTTDTDTSNAENGLYNIGSNVTETDVSYETNVLSHNNTSTENNVQPAKENTNVILNGETVVLLQKSPNSNLYIINKAVENSRDDNDEEITRLKEKTWLPTPEECGQFEIIASSDHASFNLEVLAYNKELSYQENKFIVGRNKGIKMDPEDAGNLAETKTYSKKLPTDILPVTSQIYQDVNVMSKSMDKRKSSKSNIAFRQNIKQEFNSIPNHIASNCAIQGCSGIHAHSHEVDTQHSLHIPVTHPTTLPSIYANCAANAELCVPCHKHCTSVSCSLQINATTSLHSHSKPGNSCGRSHCTCLNCTYDIVTHCRQCIHPASDSHITCLESNPYFLPTHSSVQTPAVQEHDRTKNDVVLGKLYDDQLLCKLENTLLQNNSIEKLEAQRESEKLFKKEINNKLPLKKRLKAHALMSMTYEERPIKTEKLDNYPGIPMMSIAALEALENTQKRSSQIVKSEYELSPSKKEDSRNGYHFNTNLVRRDYYKDVHVSNSHHNLTKESVRKHERQFRSANDQSGNTSCQESCHQRTFKTPGQRKEVDTSSPTSLKRFGAELIEQESPYKKTKKTQSPLRQTRSSKRNVPKVDRLKMGLPTAVCKFDGQKMYRFKEIR